MILFFIMKKVGLPRMAWRPTSMNHFAFGNIIIHFADKKDPITLCRTSYFPATFSLNIYILSLSNDAKHCWQGYTVFIS
jgi:hypothetical protein